MTGVDLLGEGDWLAVDALADARRYAVARTGKQLRSRLVNEASRLGNCHDLRVHTASRLVELLHVASLAHDDVIDDSPLRRGAASLGDMHGAFAAGYVGAWLFGSAAELASEFDQEVLSLLASSACELCDGEMRETLDLYNSARGEASYLDAIAGKTASLFSLSARLGGVAAGTPQVVCAKLGCYGQMLGMAFQLADDILDLLGHGDRKRQGDDVRHGVFTLPVIYAIEDDPSIRDLLLNEVDDETVATIVTAVRATGAFGRAATICDRYGKAAHELASELQAPWLRAFVDDALAPLSNMCVS